MGIWLHELSDIFLENCQKSININIIPGPLSVGEQSPSSEGESPLLLSI